ncbi:MAG: hypothetical protein CSYNP_02714 [Syntrophus sp. SKADARSKE-3]|nr:hypothetical protein [Syntrophus sp. SKADARSKE-3]
MAECRKIVLLFIAMICLPAMAWGHQDIWLKNEQGDIITPIQNSVDPYSPRKTCGGCHHYVTITSGYHFQQGFDEMKDHFDQKRPWNLSPGMFGKWLPTAAAGRLAAKHNTDTRQIDLSTYDWIGYGAKNSTRHKVKSASCGSCHPGGGPMEYGRDAQGRADHNAILYEGEIRNREALDGDFSSQSTPDKKSHFRESGVVEADCLICHMNGYNMEQRNEQLGRRNYRWAATAGAGFGSVIGAVFSYSHPDAGPGNSQFASGIWNFSRRPVVSFAWSDRRLFAPDGRINGQVVKKAVASRNCLQCHSEGEAKNTGTLHTSEYDAHVKAGLMCTDCHIMTGKSPAERLRHQIAKGRSSILTVRKDLDGAGMKTCVGCHSLGKYRPTRPGMPKAAKNPVTIHAGLLPQATFHTYVIACNGCHVTAQPAQAMVLLDMSTGQEMAYSADRFEGIPQPAKYAKAVRKPWTTWKIRNSQYLPAVPKWMQWFGEKQLNGEIRPIPLRYIEKAAKTSPGLTVISANMPGGAMDKRQTVVSDRDIQEMIKRLTAMGFRKAVYLSDRVYALEQGRVVSYPLPEKTLFYPIQHGVAPLAKKMAYGAKGKPDGCMDCHRDNAPFFSKMEIKNIRGFLMDDYPKPKEPNAVLQYETWGLRRVPSFE